MAAVDVDEMLRWAEAGRRLRARDPERFRRALELARTYLSIYEKPDESDEVFQARLALIRGRKGEA